MRNTLKEKYSHFVKTNSKSLTKKELSNDIELDSLDSEEEEKLGEENDKLQHQIEDSCINF